MSRARSAARSPLPLTIAGADPTAGAGLEADLLTFAAHGLHGLAIATALTEQDTRAVEATHPVAPRLLRARLATVLDDVRIDGIKTGLIPSSAAVREVAAAIRRSAARFVIVDPVLGPTHGKPFLDKAGMRAMRDLLLPRATVLTPNLREAAILLGWSLDRVRRRRADAAAALRLLGPRAVILKGGHLRGEQAVDLLDDGEKLREFALPRLSGARRDAHGTGCALSSALLANLLLGHGIDTAAVLAKAYVHRAIAGSRRIGRGRNRLALLPNPPA
jgi:hydroxymethylpyrimidine/phosphomethylpyrimidine kinase